jgi:hypothetical protein
MPINIDNNIFAITKEISKNIQQKPQPQWFGAFLYLIV